MLLPNYGYAASAFREHGQWALPLPFNLLPVILADGTSPETTLEQQPRAGIGGPDTHTDVTYEGVTADSWLCPRALRSKLKSPPCLIWTGAD